MPGIHKLSHFFFRPALLQVSAKLDCTSGPGFGEYYITEKIDMQGILGTVIGSTDEYFISSINSEALSRRYIDNNELRLLSEKSRKEDNPILCLFKIITN